MNTDRLLNNWQRQKAKGRRRQERIRRDAEKLKDVSEDVLRERLNKLEECWSEQEMDDDRSMFHSGLRIAAAGILAVGICAGAGVKGWPLILAVTFQGAGSGLIGWGISGVLAKRKISVLRAAVGEEGTGLKMP